MKTDICSGCSNKIIGIKYPIKGKFYCESCYKEIIEKSKQKEDQKAQVYSLLKEIFVLSDLPQEVISAIDREIASKKTPEGICFTLRYYYTVLENTPDDVSRAVYIIRDYYEEAKKYAQEVRKMKEHNKKVNINVPGRKIVIKQSTEKKHNFGYNIEDL